jgi:UDP-glucose 4-epimerase
VTGRLEALTGTRIHLHSFDLTDHDKTEHLFATEHFDGVIHFAGHKAVGESVEKPLEYYENNLGSTFSLVRAMRRHGVDKLVFSSSATVYGADAPVPMGEDLPTSATNPYGWTKVMQEQVLRDVAAADPTWRIALLRYFNPVGAHASGTIGEDPSDIPNNLMPYIAQVAVGRREKLSVFGGDYDTPDGTGVRDYIHVEDLAAGHIAALHRLGDTDASVSTWNLGTGNGTSVLELLAAFERACGHTLPYEIVDRRPGDIAASYADPSRAEAELGWRATRTVDDMCADTWRWQSKNPHGYPEG